MFDCHGISIHKTDTFRSLSTNRNYFLILHLINIIPINISLQLIEIFKNNKDKTYLSV